MWQVLVIEGDKERVVYRDRWMPTTDNMQVVGRVRGKKYKVLNPKGEDKTSQFHYGQET